MNRTFRLLYALLPAACGLLALTPAPARAATLTVTSSADSGVGSLRGAIITANGDGGDDTITFASTVISVILTSGQLAVTAPMTIDGSGVTVSGNNNSNVFNINGGTASIPLVLNGLTIKDGNADGLGASSFGGGIFSDGG